MAFIWLDKILGKVPDGYDCPALEWIICRKLRSNAVRYGTG